MNTKRIQIVNGTKVYSDENRIPFEDVFEAGGSGDGGRNASPLGRRGPAGAGGAGAGAERSGVGR